MASDSNARFKIALAKRGDTLLQLLKIFRQTANDRIGGDSDRQADCEDNTEPSQGGWKARLERRPDHEKLAPIVQPDRERAVPHIFMKPSEMGMRKSGKRAFWDWPSLRNDFTPGRKQRQIEPGAMVPKLQFLAESLRTRPRWLEVLRNVRYEWNLGPATVRFSEFPEDPAGETYKKSEQCEASQDRKVNPEIEAPHESRPFAKT